jgi:hypothetical protein
MEESQCHMLVIELQLMAELAGPAWSSGLRLGFPPVSATKIPLSLFTSGRFLGFRGEDGTSLFSQLLKAPPVALGIFSAAATHNISSEQGRSVRDYRICWFPASSAPGAGYQALCWLPSFPEPCLLQYLLGLGGSGLRLSLSLCLSVSLPVLGFELRALCLLDRSCTT